MSWEKLLPAIMGLLGVLIALLFTGWGKARKQAEMRRANALVEFAEFAWGDHTADDIDYTRKLSGLSVFADKAVLETLAVYNRSDCAAKGDQTRKCRRMWVEAVTAMRAQASAEQVSVETLVTVLWGDIGQP